ncbi:hypothetical protein [Marinobacterium marinum]|uniref:Uncharacterized protein n=1 Tax=Marinobacterium marinum TaxID=2756129 RepID=A0A7W2ABS9_9GAMM|nr:hypothetical protein [Marinobacterium marinum]MBA4501764.1 hypothetical protein [Marinobacterium marinum]
MKLDTTGSQTSTLHSLRRLLPAGSSWLIGSVLLQCITVGILIAISLAWCKLHGLSLEDSAPPILIVGTGVTLMLATGVFLVIMQKNIGIMLCRVNATLLTLTTAMSSIQAWHTGNFSLLPASLIGFAAAVIVLILYLTPFLSGYIRRAHAIRQQFWHRVEP